jgi:hypothetical protein
MRGEERGRAHEIACRDECEVRAARAQGPDQRAELRASARADARPVDQDGLERRAQVAVEIVDRRNRDGDRLLGARAAAGAAEQRPQQ